MSLLKETDPKWYTPGRIGFWLIHVLLTLLPLTGLVMLLCPECYYRLLYWIYGDPDFVSQRTRIVLWTSALLPAVLVYGFQALRFWYVLIQKKERRFIRPYGTQGFAQSTNNDRIRRVLFWTVVGVAIFTWASTRLTGWPWVFWYHDLEMMRFEHSLRKVPLPDDAGIIASKRRFGLLWANGNHCDSQVLLLVETDQPPVQMSYLVEKPVQMKRPFSSSPGNIDLIKVDGDDLYQVFSGQVYPIHVDSLLYAHSTAPARNRWDASSIGVVQQLVQDVPQQTGKHYYALIAEDSVLFGNDLLDIRCH